MISDGIRQKLQDIVRGTLLEGQADHCTTVRNLLCQGFCSDPTVKTKFESRLILKEEQAHFLKSHAENNGLWISGLSADTAYLTRGGESEIYLAPDHRYVIKKNDAIYYASWTEDRYDENVIAKNDVLFFIDTVFYVIEKK